MMRRFAALLTAIAILTTGTFSHSAPLPQGMTVFKKVDFYVQRGEEMEDEDARIVIDADNGLVYFADEDNPERVTYAVIDIDAINAISYSNTKHPRWKSGAGAAVALGVLALPFFFMSGKKHWLTITYDGEGDEPGGYVFARMDKGNYQAILASLNAYTGVEVRRVMEDDSVDTMYPGRQGSLLAQEASQDPGRSPGATPVGDVPVPAGRVPGGETVTGPMLVSRSVQWTQRSAGVVGYTWSGEVLNPTASDLPCTVTLILLDASEAVIHTAEHHLLVPADNSTGFNAFGEVAEDVALQGNEWSFSVAEASQDPIDVAPPPAEIAIDPRDDPRAADPQDPAAAKPDPPTAAGVGAAEEEPEAGLGALSGEILEPEVLQHVVHWTEWRGSSLGYAWEARVENPNPAELKCSVSLRLHNLATDVLYEVHHELILPPGGSATLNTRGEVEESDVNEADHWSINISADTCQIVR